MRKIWLSFILACIALIVPISSPADGYRYILYEDFEQNVPPIWPGGWTFLDANLDGKTWEAKEMGGGGGGGCARYLSGLVIADDWLFTPAISLNSGTTYNLSFKIRVTSSSMPHKLTAKIGTAPLPGSMTTDIFLLPNIINVDAQETSNTFTVSSTGIYYIGFNCTSAPGQLALFVDDVGVSVQETGLIAVLQMDKSFYNSGANTYTPAEEKKCLVYVKNTGGSPVKVNNLFTIGDVNDQSSLLSFEVKDPGGNTVPYKARNKMAAPEERNFVTLAPGESVYKYYDLNSGVFDFSATGTYTIKAIYRNLYQNAAGDAWRGKIISAPVTIKIQ